MYEEGCVWSARAREGRDETVAIKDSIQGEVEGGLFLVPEGGVCVCGVLLKVWWVCGMWCEDVM